MQLVWAFADSAPFQGRASHENPALESLWGKHQSPPHEPDPNLLKKEGNVRQGEEARKEGNPTGENGELSQLLRGTEGHLRVTSYVQHIALAAGQRQLRLLVLLPLGLECREDS
ncbi:hypothetical protein DV515_00008714 [Chloebia gouldiae]|uniref:Uncharacterized protein n=1 Tax=Chloebia gouldiae TaxID=44316 RepID=A0A3L8SF29_CHLGU|nr:hypothetical protein DV515_00008714 [Chloebia gouldiae]